MFLFCSCAKNEEKTDNYYFLGLKKIESGEKNEAVTLFEKGVRNSSPLVSKLCSLFLSEINKKEAVEIIGEALKKFPEDNSINCRYMAVLYEAGKYDALYDFSEEKREFLGKDNEYIKFRLLALAKTGNNAFASEFEDWFTGNRITSYHREFLDDWYKDSSYTEYKYFNEEFYKTFQRIVNLRLYVNSGNYSRAYNEMSFFVQNEKDIIEFICSKPASVLSDIGKAYLYGSTDKAEDALLFSRAAAVADTNEKKQILFFYAGRLLDKAGAPYRNTALENLRASFSFADNVSARDNALWYYLETARHISVEKAVTALNELAPLWSDPEYFDDFLDDICMDIIYSKGFDLFCEIFEKNKFFLSEASFTKYAYITARLIEEELSFPPSGSKTAYISSLLNMAWEKSESNCYYRILLADKLNKTEAEFYSSEEVLLEARGSEEEKLAEGLIENELYSRFYGYYKDNWRNISEKVSLSLIGILKDIEKDNKDVYADILRLASTGLSDSEYIYRKDIERALYPRFYEEEVTEKANAYKVPEYFIYGLMRTESYFDYDVYSSAGAIGLCQLMEETAADIARKLKKEEYSLIDAETNMDFGIYYLQELVSRLEGNAMDAFLSYNCGITRVRRWKEEFSFLPNDLFLEVVPIEETREYGKKILTSACLYGNLYYEKAITEVLKELKGTL
ncbi:MAG: lytic transglycosylase domain-containing protein [Treponemataceae bacterium]|nr:lytic transglycosylase domain-containing protein [Treponemataceae bacterium]